MKLWALTLGIWVACSSAWAQAPSGGLSPLAPPPAASPPGGSDATTPAPVPFGPGAVPPSVPSRPGESLLALPSAPDAGAPDPVLFVSEGVEGLLAVPDLRRRLSEALGRELVSLTDPRAHRAQATVFVGLSERSLVLRVTPPHRPEVWRRLAREALGADPAATVVKAVLEMFWADTFARLDAAEVQDPFCPPGVICVDARRAYPWPPTSEAEVLDPWGASYRRLYGWDPFTYAQRPSASTARSAPYPGAPGQRLSAGPYGLPRGDGGTAPRSPATQKYALSALTGGGVHKGGAFFRYELDALRRFRRFDFGLAFIGARGQPEPPHKARRAITALLQRRLVADDFELDLGASVGLFLATFEGRKMEVRPYLRGVATFALPIGRLFDFLVQSDLATTVAAVPETGAVEYALSLGLRHRM